MFVMYILNLTSIIQNRQVDVFKQLFVGYHCKFDDGTLHRMGSHVA